MISKFSLVLLAVAMIFSWTMPVEAQDGKSPEKREAEDKVIEPQSPTQAQETFLKAFELEQKEKYNEAVLQYQAALTFYRKQQGAEYERYAMNTMHNLGVIFTNQGKHEAAIEMFQGVLQYAVKLGLYNDMAEVYHKLGILYSYLGQLKAKKQTEKNNIYPTENPAAPATKLFNKGVYTRLVQVGNEFTAQNIEVAGPQNPFAKRRELYTHLLNLKVRGDFDPEELLVPDGVKLIVQINKKGYVPVVRSKDMLPEMPYEEFAELMMTMPRKIEPKIVEDFFREGTVMPDEITLARIGEGGTLQKAIAITDKETFKPGNYKLTINKAGYESINENYILYPDDVPQELRRELKSKLRSIVSTIRSDFTALGVDTVTPDEISLNNQRIQKDSKVKPSQYKLVIKKDGYEPIIENLTIPPAETPYPINKSMRCLPREVLFEITGDYQKDTQLTPDEITFNGRFIKVAGESLRPDNYRVMIRKKGYEPITKPYTIEPKSEPYVVKESLRSLPRRVQLNILGSFPANTRLNPDVCTLNGKSVATTESYKPGSYQMVIKHRGYIPVTKDIEIEPSDDPYIIQQVLTAKDVQLDVQISHDVPPQDTTVAYTVSMENEKTRGVVKVKTGDIVPTESYLIKVEMPGYDTDTQREVIYPREEVYPIQRRLISSLRRVVTQITADFPEGETIVPDEITLNNKPIGKDFKVKPGVHDLVILKEGYLPIRKQVKILASDKDFILAERMETKTRIISFEFRDTFDNKKLTPEELTVGGEQANPNTQLNLKPGEYPVKARLKGYGNIDDKESIPVGSEPWVIRRKMTAIVRDYTTLITGDYEPGKELEVDTFTLNDTPMPRRGTIKPNMYSMVIQKKGYFPILERMTIAPDPKPYEIKQVMVSKPRKLQLNIKSSFTNAPITPQTVMVGPNNVKDGQVIKPDPNLPVLIKEKGYKTISTNISIEPNESPYDLSYLLESLPRLVKYELVGDFDNKEVVPDVITLNDKIVDQKTVFNTGKYTLKIEKRGYHPKQMEIVIEPEETVYVIKATLESMAREIELNITGDFPKGERIDPQVVALNTKDARDNMFKPGKYELDIQQPGYFPMKKDLVISPGEEPFLIEEELVTKPRLIKEKISFDVTPPESLPPHKMTIAPLDKPKQEKQVKDGETIKPGSYLLKITKEAYETIEVKKHIWPDETPQDFQEMMIAKQVTIHLNVTHDINPPANLPECTVSLIDPRTGVLNLVTHGNKIKPGKYDLDIQRPGYSSGTRRQIEILPSEQPYSIKGHLMAKPRNISFDMVDPKTMAMVQAVEILKDEGVGKPGSAISFKDFFEAGRTVSLIIKFKKYQTVRKTAVIEPGDGPYVVPVALKELVRQEFTTPQNDLTLDDIKYEYNFFADNNPVESHLISVEKGIGRFYYTIWVDAEAKNLRAHAGYLYAEVPFERIKLGLGRLENISIPRLITHLDAVGQKDERGRRASLEVMEKLMKLQTNHRKIKQCPIPEIDQLIQYIEGWKLDQAQDRVRSQVVVESLNKLKKDN